MNYNIVKMCCVSRGEKRENKILKILRESVYITVLVRTFRIFYLKYNVIYNVFPFMHM